jgi:tRNA A-37 threonylcarbamoyl transferase component Bud32/membrane-associated phospholipid phosphatase
METPAERSSQAAGSRAYPVRFGALRSPRRRRPTGEPPALPYQLQTSGIGWLVATLVLVALSTVAFAQGLRGPAVTITVVDDAVVGWLSGLRRPGLTGGLEALAALSSWWMLQALGAGLALALLALRRIRHLIIVVILAEVLSVLVLRVLGAVATRPRPFGVAVATGWGGWALPSLQVTLFTAALVAVLYTLVPEGRWRNTGKWVATALVALAALGRMALGADAPTDVLVGAAVGATVPLLAFRRFTPNAAFPISYRAGRSAHLDIGGARGEAIRRGFGDQLGLVVLDVEPFGQRHSASCTPLRITVEGDPPVHLFGKLYAQSHVRADRWYKLGRELVYGRLEDEKAFNTVRRLMEREDYALRLLRDSGLPVPKPVGSVELTPEREYLLVTEFLDGAEEISGVEVDDALIDQGLAAVRRLWDARLAHRDIKPANLLVQDRQLRLIDAFLTEVHPSPWRQAVDLANMLLVLALRTDPRRVYERARRMFTDEEIGEALTARQGRARPAQVRALLRADPRDLREEFLRLLSRRPRPFGLQRWTIRRVGLLTAVAALLGFAGWAMVGLIGNDLAVKTPLHVRDVSCTQLEPMWLMAQSVPSTSLVPCLSLLPVGWSVGTVAVNDGRSVIELDHDRAGSAAVVLRLTATCDPGDATHVRSQVPGVERYEETDYRTGRFVARWYDRFRGGCVTYELESATDPDGRFADETTLMFGFTARAALDQALEARSAGRLHLDPTRV